MSPSYEQQLAPVQTVKIPTDYFKTSVTKAYRNVQTALIRELLQNSIDAGANKIDCIIQDETLIWQDNGRGMSKGRMIEAMLTMGGSVKEEGSVGGFGEAKILILFAQKAFEIISLNTSYAGEGLTYWPIDRKYLQGTKISLTLADIPQLTYFLENNARRFIGTCNLAPGINISINGVKANTNSSLGKPVVTVPKLGRVHQRKWKKNEERSESVLVQHNGVTMFSHYTGATSERVVLSLENSAEVMTSNRDGFEYNHEWRFDKFIKGLIQSDGKINPEPENLIIVYGRREAIQFIRSTLEGTNFSPKISEGLQNLANALESQTEAPTEEWETCLERLNDFPGLAQDLEIFRKKATISTDFIIFKGPLKVVPKKFHPDTMGKKEKILAILWKKCITSVLEKLHHSLTFNIGWTFNPEVQATIHKEESPEKHIFFFNPQALNYKIFNRDTVYSILLTAIHEVTHLYYAYHGDGFSAEFQRILLETYEISDTWQQLIKEAKKEEL